MSYWAGFAACAALIFFSGSRLSIYGDIIAEETGLGRAWTGLILMAGITSLPEFITGVSSVTFADLPDIAVGDILGACVFNLITLALLDPMDKSSPLFLKVGQSHLLSAGFGIMLISIVSVSVMLGDVMPSFGHVGLYTPAIIIIYLAGIRAVYLYEKRFIRKFAEKEAERIEAGVPLKKAYLMYALNSLVIIGAAVALPVLAGRIAESAGLAKSFVGTVLVAFATSMPEFIVSISAIRIGAYDLAIGNLLGSNLFNIALLAVDDLIYLKGPILSSVSGAHSATGLMAVFMTGIVLVGITYRPEKKIIFRFGWESMAILLAGLLNIYILYALGNHG